jgi:formamidopyrimidine-DNA glycosylase
MPELPEVETMRRGILAAVGSRILRVEKLKCPRKPIRIEPAIATLRKRVQGRRIAAVDRLGKRVVIRLDSDDRLVFEPRMTGLVLVADPPSQEHLRFRIDLAGGPLKSIWYWDRRGLGSVRLFSLERFERELASGKLGPDALAVTAEELQAIFAASNRPIKVALLDQARLAGVGNMYASEILHLAGICPERPCARLKPDDWRRLHQFLREVLETAIRYEGSTLSDGTYRNALNQAGGYQNHHRVYDRAGMPCSTCGQAVLRIVQAQRATFYCPTCQPSQKRRAKILRGR